MDLFLICHLRPVNALNVQDFIAAAWEKRLYGARRAASRAQSADGGTGYSPQSRYICAPGQTCQAAPTRRPQHRRTGMAFCGVNRGAENQPGPGPLRPQQLRCIMRRGGDEARTVQKTAPAAAQMQPGLQTRRQPRIARHHQHQAPCPAQGCNLAPQRQPVGSGIVAEHHAAQAARQVTDDRQRVGQAGGIGEKP